MLLDLSEVFSNSDKTLKEKVTYEEDTFFYESTRYTWLMKPSASIEVKNAGKKKASFYAHVSGLLEVPCDRCLIPTEVTFDFDVSEEIDLNQSSSDDKLQEISQFISEDKRFDTQGFLDLELFAHYPPKVLCKEDCKGLCKKCGKNLNDGACSCNREELDPRMAKALEVFNQFKEV